MSRTIIAIFLFCAVESSIAQTQPARPGQLEPWLPDTGFESGTTGIFTDGVEQGTLTVETASENVHTGRFSLKHQATGASFTRPGYGSYSVDLDPERNDETLRFSAWVKADAPDTRVRLFIFCFDEAGKTRPEYYSTTGSNIGTEWERVSHTHTCPAATRSARVRLDNMNAGQTVWWDDLHLRRVTNYFPDPGFESGRLEPPFADLHRGALALDENNPRKGTFSLRHTATAPDSYTIPWWKSADAVMASAATHKNFAFSAWAKAETDTSVQLYLFCLDDAYEPVESGISFSRFNVNARWWRRLEHTTTCPEATSYVSVRLDNDGGAGSTVWWDDLVLEPTPMVESAASAKRATDSVHLTFEGLPDGQFIPPDVYASDGIEMLGLVSLVARPGSGNFCEVHNGSRTVAYVPVATSSQTQRAYINVPAGFHSVQMRYAHSTETVAGFRIWSEPNGTQGTATLLRQVVFDGHESNGIPDEDCGYQAWSTVDVIAEGRSIEFFENDVDAAKSWFLVDDIKLGVTPHTGQVSVNDSDGRVVFNGGRFSLEDVEGGETKSAAFTISNHGSGDITINGVTVEGEGFQQGSSLPDTLQPNQEADFSVVFDSEGLGSGLHEGVVTIELSGADVDSFSFAVDATVVLPPRLELISEDGAVINLDEPFVCCTAQLGEGPQLYDLRVRNRGDRDLHILDVGFQNTAGDAFRLTERPITILQPYDETQEGPETSIQIELLADESGEFRSRLTLDTNSPERPQVDLEVTGNVISPGFELRDGRGRLVPPDFLQFLGTTELEVPIEEIFSIKNTGSDPLEVLASSAIVDEEFDGSFEFFSPAGDEAIWPRTLAPGALYEFGIRFKANLAGEKTVQVKLDYQQGGERRTYRFRASANVEADGGSLCIIVAKAEPDASFPPDPNSADPCRLYGDSVVDFGQQPPGTEVKLWVTFTNLGDAPLKIYDSGTSADGVWNTRFEPEPPETLDAGSLFTAIVELEQRDKPGRSSAELFVLSDDPDFGLSRITTRVDIGGPDGGGAAKVQVRNVQGDEFKSGDTVTILPMPAGLAIPQTFYIDNLSSTYLTIDELEVGTESVFPVFRHGTHPLPSVAPSEDTVFSILVGPAPAGNYKGFISFKTNASAEPFKLNLSVTVNNQEGNGPRASFSAPGIPLLPVGGRFDFGATPVGSGIERQFTIKNDGNEDLTISEIATIGEGFTYRSTPGRTIAPGKSRSFFVRMAADDPGTLTGRVSFQTNAVNGPVVAFDVVGRVLEEAVNQPKLSVFAFDSPLANGVTYTLAPVHFYNERSVAILVKNTGNADLEILRFTKKLHPLFELSGSVPRTLRPGQSARLVLVYDPVSSSTPRALATLEWFTNVPEAPIFSITVEGITLPSDDVAQLVVLGNGRPISSGEEYFVGFSGPGCSITDTLELFNIGRERLDIFELSVTGDGFSRTSTPPSKLESNERVPFTLKQLDTEPGPLHGAVSVRSSDPSQDTYSFNLRGEVLGPCEAGPNRLCLQDERFAVELDFVDPRPGGSSSQGRATPFSDRTGLFWFFKQENIEVVVKILDGRTINGSYWVYYGGLTNLAYTLTVRDTVTGRVQVFQKPKGSLDGDALTNYFDESCELQRASTRTLDPTTATFDIPSTNVSSGVARSGSCIAGPHNLCLYDDRFKVEVDWVNQHQGNTGVGGALPATHQMGMFWFFNDKNIELAVKVHDGRAVNEHFWVFVGSLTDVEFTLRITDTLTGEIWTHRNPPGAYKGHADIEAFAVAPEMRLVRDWDGMEVIAGSNVDFPEAVAGETVSRTFRIHNDGDQTLQLDNAGALVSGAGFVQVGAAPVTLLGPGESSAFTVEFHATTAGASSSGSVSIASNDPNEASFAFNLRADVQTAPDHDPPLLHVARPSQNETIAGTTTVQGWATDASGVATLQFQLDGASIQLPNTVYGTARGDVCQTHGELGDPNCPNVGWSATLDSTPLSDGTHSFEVIVTDSRGNTETVTRNITIANHVPDEEPPRIGIARPSAQETLEGAAVISGWAVDASGIANWSFRIDGNVVQLESLTTVLPRADVCAAHSDLGDPRCPNVGWEGVLDTLPFTNGQHKLTVRLTDNEGNVDGLVRWFHVNNPVDTEPPRIHVDAPTHHEETSGRATIRGWAIDASGIADWSFRIDGNVVQLEALRTALPRAGVCDLHSDLEDPRCPNVGWEGVLDTHAIDNGLRKLTVRLTDAKGNVDGFVRWFNVNNPVDTAPPLINVDAPAHNAELSGHATIRGWAVDSSGVDQWSFRIDGNVVSIGSLNTSVPRGDVCSVHSALNDPNCPNVGWQGILDTTAFSNGTYKLTVRLTDAKGNVDGFQRTFKIKN